MSKSYLDQGCSPIDDKENSPVSHIMYWSCPGQVATAWAYTMGPSPTFNNYCMVFSDTCKVYGVDIKVASYRFRYGRESCDGKYKIPGEKS